MSYASVEDFVLRVGEGQAIDLTDREREDRINEAVLNVALEDSSSEIDAYLSSRYTLPLAKVPANLVRLCCDIARYRLCSMTDVTISDDVRERYEKAIDELKLLAKGTISLGIEQQLDADPTGDMVVMFNNGNTRVFSRDDYQNRKGFDSSP
ncbi:MULTISPECIES: gp436 family protein [Glaesserella]|uniref:DUF1320 domain-containing protein n=1 Tax=Glaesserella australis TaxID=2094024 RepID=A0A328BWK4_9PAST|nr:MULTISPECIES: phage protein Gp36 family protein [Glaesserella]AUI65207.1 hypothetical protein CJD39_00835 [Glaesserella sp. 15-184]RAL18479.1 DUF1320 domain-containing protein [Glaesserella australis]